jgi:hypothetical protein
MGHTRRQRSKGCKSLRGNHLLFHAGLVFLGGFLRSVRYDFIVCLNNLPQKVFEFHRFGQIVKRAGFNPRHTILRVCVTREEDDFCFMVALLDFKQRIDAAYSGHHDIHNDNIHWLFRQHRKARLSIRGLKRRQTSF